MVETLREIEAIPETYPDIFEYAHTNRDSLPEDAYVAPDLIWQRIEAYCAYRWTPREVLWIVSGPGQWEPRLSPATLTLQEVWTGEAWETTTLSASPLDGLELTKEGPYRFTATVGADNPVPEAVGEAFRRLHEYSRGIAESWRGSASTYIDADGSQAPVGWAGKAIQLSGAADLLRPYKRRA